MDRYRKRELLLYAAVLVVMAAVILVFRPRYLSTSRSSDAAYRARTLITACEAYRLHPDAVLRLTGDDHGRTPHLTRPPHATCTRRVRPG